MEIEAYGFSLRKRIISDPDGFDDAVSGMNLKVNYRLRQQRPSNVLQFQTPGVACDFGELYVKSHIRGATPTDGASMCILRGPGKAVFNGLSGDTGTLLYLPPGAELDGCAEPGMQWVTIAVPSSMWESSRLLAGAEPDDVGHQPGWHLDEKRRVGIMAGLRELERLISVPQLDQAGADLAAAAAGDLAAYCAILVWELSTRRTGRSVSPRNRARIARRAHEWMVDHLGEDFCILTLCRYLGVSRRELEYAFRMTLDISPVEHLKSLRLNAIRRELRHPDCMMRTITEIAYRHGVRHLGRFSLEYRRTFGETPTETRKSCRKHGA